MDETKCKEMVHDRGGWHSNRCGKPIKRDGLCGVHARMKERRAERTQRWRDEGCRRDEHFARLKKLSERAGFKVDADFCLGKLSYITVTVPVVELEKLLDLRELVSCP